MKKFFIPLLFISFILLSCGGSMTLVGTNDWTDPLYNYSITLPDGWTNVVYPGTGQIRMKTVKTEYSRGLVRDNKILQDGGIELNPQFYLKVIPDDKDLTEYIEKIKKGYYTEFFNLYDKNRYKTDREISRDEPIELWDGAQKAHTVQIGEIHYDPLLKDPITLVYGVHINAVVNFIFFKKDGNIYHIEFICPDRAAADHIRDYDNLVDSIKFN